MWKGSVSGKNKSRGGGYGNFVVYGSRGVPQNIKAHRLAWLLEHGTLPSSRTMVCHACDVRLCVNPQHLFLGSNTDNMRDASAKGRLAQKLNPKKVLIIRALSMLRLSYTEIGRLFDVDESTVRDVATARIWGFVADTPEIARLREFMDLELRWGADHA